jgi:hypothetical protein
VPARPDLRRIVEAQVGGDGQSGSGRAHHGFPSCPATGCLYPSSREAVGSSSSLPLSLPREAVGRVAHRERSETMCRVGVVQRIPMPAASFARLGPHPTGLRPATLPTKNGGGIRNTVARPCRSNGSSSRGALATKQSMFPLRLDGSSLALAMTVQNKPRRRPLSLPPLRAGREKRQRVRRPASPPSRCPTFAGAISRTARGCNT